METILFCISFNLEIKVIVYLGLDLEGCTSPNFWVRGPLHDDKMDPTGSTVLE